MPLTLVCTAQPAEEPVSLAEVKLHCKVDGTDDDGLLAGLVAAARRYCETATGRAFVTQTWRLSLDTFPWFDGGSPAVLTAIVGTPKGQGSSYAGWINLAAVRLPKNPVQSVTSVVYDDTTGAAQTLSPTLYRADLDTEPARLTPAYGQIWPIVRAQTAAVRITFVAGFPCTTVALATAAGAQTVTPATVAGIAVGSSLVCDTGAAREVVTVTAVAATTFTATFAKDHAANWRVNNVPDEVQAAVKLLVGHWYVHREAVGQNPGGPLEMAVESLLSSVSTGEYR